MPPRRPRRQDQGGRLYEAGSDPGRPRSRCRRDAIPPLQPRVLAHVPPGGASRRQTMPPRKLREPSMPPSMEKVKGEKLRTGWTTGTCAAAAAKAATKTLVSGEPQARVDVKLPGKGAERRVEFEVERCELGGSWAEAVVVKDAGDDPDVTDGAHLTARVSWREEPGLELDRGEGVGVVTKPGLGLPVGGPAINAVPRRMISYSVRGGPRPRRARRPGRHQRPRRREDGREDDQRPPRHRRRHLHPRHHGHRAPLLDGGVGGERRAGRQRYGRAGPQDLRPLHRRPHREGRHAPPSRPRRGELRRGRGLHRAGHKEGGGERARALLLRRDGGQDLQARRRRDDDPLDPLEGGQRPAGRDHGQGRRLDQPWSERSRTPTPPVTPTSSGDRPA